MKSPGTSPRVTTSLRQSWTRKSERGRGAEHGGDLAVGHGLVGAEGGEDVGEGVAVEVPRVLGEFPGLGVEAGEVGWDGEDAIAGTKFLQSFEEV